MNLEKAQDAIDILRRYEDIKELLKDLQEKFSKEHTTSFYNPVTQSNTVKEYFYCHRCKITICNKIYLIDDDTRNKIINVLIERRQELEKEIKEL